MTVKGSAPRLGRGLASIIPDRVSAETTPPHLLPIDKLEPGPFQPRTTMDEAALTELAESIRERGVLQPILARPHPEASGRFQIIAGERRWRAAQRAGLHELPALVRDLSDSDALAAALVENLQRQDLNPIEEAEGLRRLSDEFGLTQEQLGNAVGKSRSHIANMLRLLHLPPGVQTALRKGEISAGHARALLGHPDPDKAALAVISRGLNVRQTEALARQRHDAPPTTSRTANPETEALQRDLSERLGLRVEIAFNGSGGQMRIHYRSLDQLDGLIALLSRD